MKMGPALWWPGHNTWYRNWNTDLDVNSTTVKTSGEETDSGGMCIALTSAI